MSRNPNPTNFSCTEVGDGLTTVQSGCVAETWPLVPSASTEGVQAKAQVLRRARLRTAALRSLSLPHAEGVRANTKGENLFDDNKPYMTSACDI